MNGEAHAVCNAFSDDVTSLFFIIQTHPLDFIGLLIAPATILYNIRVRLNGPSLYPCPSPSPSKFIIVSKETDRLTDRLGSEPILTV